MGRDDRAVVGHVQQAILGLNAHRLAREIDTDVVAVLEDADAALLIDSSADDLCWWLRFRFGCDVTVDDLKGRPFLELEASDRRDVTDSLVLSVVVVVGNPRIQGRLCLLDRVEAVLREELLAHGLVQPFDLAGGGRRVGGGEDVLDAVVQTDAVEQHVDRLAARRQSLDLRCWQRACSSPEVCLTA